MQLPLLHNMLSLKQNRIIYLKLWDIDICITELQSYLYPICALSQYFLFGNDIFK